MTHPLALHETQHPTSFEGIKPKNAANQVQLMIPFYFEARNSGLLLRKVGVKENNCLIQTNVCQVDYVDVHTP